MTDQSPPLDPWIDPSKRILIGWSIFDEEELLAPQPVVITTAPAAEEEVTSPWPLEEEEP
jgi:hypothetical protein